jgi:hypothetical protein
MEVSCHKQKRDNNIRKQTKGIFYELVDIQQASDGKKRTQKMIVL